MKFLTPLLLSLCLFSCVEVETNDLNNFVAETKSKVYPINEEIPELKKIEVILYAGKGERSPFSEPKAEVSTATRKSAKSCPQPDLTRKKEPLEMYSVSNLSMRGTLLIDKELWALVQVSGGEIYKVKPGYYLGLNHGKAITIRKDMIELLELASDRDGCWQERMTQITLQSQ